MSSRAAVNATFYDAVALVTGLLEPEHDPELEETLCAVLDDLEQRQHLVAAAFGALVVDLLGELAHHTGQSRAELWKAAAARTIARENRP